MSALADVFAAVRLQLDGTGFEAQATALATKSGQNAGDAMSKNISSKLKSAIGAGIGMAAGAAFSLALTGANQLDAATKQLQADTGMTDAAAKLAEHSIAGMYQNNLQGMDQIGKTLGVVINGLDLTGTAADAMTEKFLKFETATGQDSAAVSAFHEILNAWGLDASSAQHIMDLLVASHQKYGSSVADNQASLQRLAPQMKAMNMTIDDTVNLLNLFDAAGLDASKAQFALNTAVKNLKPGQTFNDLIAQVTAIQDPTLRAQEAIKLFGARGGVGLANALKPGITSLADFATSATDTAGATDKAAAAVESGFGNQAVLLLHQFGGALADFGTQFGPLLMVAATIGPKFTTALLSGLGGLGGLLVPKLVGAILGATVPAAVAGEAVGVATGAAAGTATAGAFAAAAALAFPAAVGAFIAAAGIILANAIDALFPGLAKTMHDDFFKGLDAVFGGGGFDYTADTGNGFNALGVKVTSTGNAFNNLGYPIKAATVGVKGFADAATAGGGAVGGLAETVKTFTDAEVAAGWAALDARDKIEGAFSAAAKTLLKFSPDEFVKRFREGDWGGGFGGVARAAGQAGTDAMTALAASIVADRQKPVDAMDTLTQMLKTSLSPSKEAARIAGQLTSKTLADGLKDGRADVRAQALGTYQDLISRLGALRDSTGSIGKEAMDALNAGIRSKNLQIRKVATDALATLMSGLADRAGQGGAAGKAAMDALDAGIKSKVPEISAAALVAKNAALVQLQALAGPAGAAGGAAGSAFAAALSSKAHAAMALFGVATGKGGFQKLAGGGPVTAGMPYIVGDAGRPELFVPDTNGQVLSSVPGASSSNSFSPTINIYPGHDTSLQTARRFGQAVLDEVASGLREQRARAGAF
jgi:hypothetical protein